MRVEGTGKTGAGQAVEPRRGNGIDRLISGVVRGGMDSRRKHGSETIKAFLHVQPPRNFRVFGSGCSRGPGEQEQGMLPSKRAATVPVDPSGEGQRRYQMRNQQKSPTPCATSEILLPGRRNATYSVHAEYMRRQGKRRSAVGTGAPFLTVFRSPLPAGPASSASRSSPRRIGTASEPDPA